jgi:hypothetical protein
LAFYPARDIANNVRALNNAVTPERSPYFVLRHGQLALDDTFRSLPALQPRQIWLQNAEYEFDEQVRVLQAIDAIERFGKIRMAMSAAKERAEKSGVDNLEYTIYATPTVPAMRAAWDVTEALFLAIRDEVRAHGSEFRIVVLATRPQVIPDAAKRAELASKLGVEDLNYADRRIREFGAGAGIPVIMLAPTLCLYAESHYVYLNGFGPSNLGAGHWNEAGHRVAAAAIANDLCSTAKEVSAPGTSRKE